MKQKHRVISKVISIQIIFVLLCVCLITLIYPNYSQAYVNYNQRVESGIDKFPTTYHNILNNLKSLHPNWNFEVYYTGIPWNELIAGETSLHTRNTVHHSSDSSWKCSCGQVVSGYACASQSIIEYYIDPRNFLNEVDIFQFLEISFNENVHTLEGIQSSVKNTFLNSNVTFTRNGETKTMSYAQIILDAARQSNMSPYSISTKIIQEVGAQGSGSVSGNYPGYQGYYNFFNYGGYDSGNGVENALNYAKSKNWNNQYDAIVEGAKLLADSYTNVGQNTAYFYKWDVVGTSILKAGNSQIVSSQNLFSHQYMTNIQDPTSQAKRLFNTYAQNDLLDKPLNFIIPVYESEGSSNKLPGGIDTNNPNAYYVNDADGINVRNAPSLSGGKIASISKDTVVLMKERKTTSADGYEWDKIQLANGVEGYAASEFLSPCSGVEVDKNANSEPVIGRCTTTDDLRLRNAPSTSGVKILTIPKGTTIDVLQKDVANDGVNIWYKVRYNGNVGYVSASYLTQMQATNTNNGESGKHYEIEGNNIQIAPGTTIEEIRQKYPNATGEIKTGAKMTIDGVSYTVVLKGDTNGDGVLNSADLLKVVKHLKGISVINDTNYQKAGDTNGDGTINSADLLKVVKYLKGTSTITI